MTLSKNDQVLLTGATGFIGSNLYPALEQNGYDVLCASRNPERARSNRPERNWIELDVQKPETVRQAFGRCSSVFYLIHEMSAGEGYQERERQAATTVRDAAEEMGVNRLVYLGGVAPEGKDVSEHLRSRLQTGKILRNGRTSTVELRASMVIGPGSSSWQIVRDLAARLPVMLLPKWTQSRTQPVFVDDVIKALVGALELEDAYDGWYDIPGPETMSVEEILRRTANILQVNPWNIRVPVLSPRLSSYWLQFVTRADLYVAQELVEGLKTDLLAQDDRFWELIGDPELTGFNEAVRRTAYRTSVGSRSLEWYESLVRALSPA